MHRSSLARPRHRNAPRPAEKSAKGFLQWLRGRECACASDLCAGRMEAAHVPHKATKGVGTKSSDAFAIPLCSSHHRSQHSLGWQTFQNLYGFSAENLAEAYWQAWPGRIAWERKLADG
jgi:hypothetical protein